MAVPPNSVFEVCFKYSFAGQTCRNYIHFRNAQNIVGIGGWEAANEFALAELAGPGDTMLDALQVVLADNVTIFEATCQVVFPTRARMAVAPLNMVGTDASDCSTPNVQAAIEKYGELATRHNVGGNRIGGVPHDNYANGVLTAPYLASLELLAVEWYDQKTVTIDGVPIDFFPVIPFHTKTVVDGKDTFPITGSTPIVGWAVKPQCRTQRSRTVGRGE